MLKAASSLMPRTFCLQDKTLTAAGGLLQAPPQIPIPQLRPYLLFWQQASQLHQTQSKKRSDISGRRKMQTAVSPMIRKALSAPNQTHLQQLGSSGPSMRSA